MFRNHNNDNLYIQKSMLQEKQVIIKQNKKNPNVSNQTGK